PQGNIIDMNAATLERLGYDPGQVRGMQVADIMDPSQAVGTARIGPIGQGDRVVYETVFHTKTGATVPVEVSVRAIEFEGKPGYLGVARDITLRKATERELLSRDAILEAVSYVAASLLLSTNWEREIDSILKHLGTAADVGSVYLFQVSFDREGGGSAYMRHWWIDQEDKKPFDLGEYLVIPFDTGLSDWLYRIPRGEPVFGGLDDIPGPISDILRATQSESVVITPIRSDLSFWGVMAFVESSRGRTWTRIEVDALQAAANIISSAIIRTEIEELFHSPVESSLIGVYVIQDGKFPYVNPQLARIFGYTREEVVDHVKVRDLVHPDDWVLVDTNIGQRLSGGMESLQYEFRGRRKSGDVIWIEAFGSRTMLNGRPAIVGNLIDMTEQKRASQTIAANAHRLSVLNQIVSLSGKAESLHELLCSILESAIVLLGCETGEVYLAEDGAMKRMARVRRSEELSFRGEAGNERIAVLRDDNICDELPVKDSQVYVTPLLGKRGVIGKLVLAYPGERTLSEEDSEILTSIGHELGSMVEKMQYEEQLRRSLDDKTALLREVHHRVKNNMQVISSLLHLQSAHLGDERLRTHFRESETRIKSMALVHETLYLSDSFASINAGEYIQRFVSEIIGTYAFGLEIGLVTDVEDIALDLDTSIPFGLILHEIIINSLQHAFTGRKSGTITISMKRVAEGKILLMVGDDGRGLPEDLDPGQAETLGLQLITILVRQLEGTLQTETGGGTRFIITFPEGKPG
ncbi:MAG: PAS domain S-box protein, partial [Methanoregulaceae archaeon]|nr:PAS domain S-box protein [Methanoregulaceae archaeon]